MVEQETSWKKACLSQEATLGEAIRTLNRTGLRLVLVVTRKRRLLGTVSDGDIRRGLLRGLTLRDSLNRVMNLRPLVISPLVEATAALEIMRANHVFQLPIVDKRHNLYGLSAYEALKQKSLRKNAFIIMAGGKGTRMMPYTHACPKPMLPVDGKPMLEHILVRAKEEGFRNFFICVYHLGHQVERYFQEGRKWGVQIRYVREKKPLGTAGAVGLLPVQLNEAAVVSNGDILTEVKYGDLLDFHEKNQAFATMAVQLHSWEHPFGVVRLEGAEIAAIEEKPLSRAYVNAGIYVLSAGAIRIPSGNKPLNMPDLFSALKMKRKKLLAYPLHEPWLDVGRPTDLSKAQNMAPLFKTMRSICTSSLRLKKAPK